MPMITIRYVTPEPRPQLREQVAELARSLGHNVLGKDPNVTAVLVEEADPDGWFIAGERPAQSSRAHKARPPRLGPSDPASPPVST